MAQFIGNIIMRGKIECLTGLHIGAGKDTAEIGGVDSPVVRDPHSRRPYIPGSSLKGKMRSMLEFATGKVKDGKVHTCNEARCEVCRPLGSSAADARKCGPTRLLVRDAYPDEQTQGMWENLNTDLLYAEMKSENFLDRITLAANPRFIERIVKGSRFDLEMIYGVYQVDGVNDLDFFAHVVTALRLLEDGTLGGNGSRGYGQIRLKMADPVFLSGQDYCEGSDAWKQAREWPADEAFVRGMGDFSLNREDATCQSWDEIMKSPEDEVGKEGPR